MESQPAVRKHLTSFGAITRQLELQMLLSSSKHRHQDRQQLLQPHFNYLRDVTTPRANMSTPADGICAHFLLHGYNRLQKSAVNTGCWSADGRRLVLGTQAGEFTLWEGDTFKFERLISAHAQAIRSMAWTANSQILVSGDASGVILYFDSSLRNVGNIPDAHTAAVQGLSFAPSESKFASCGDDGLVGVWDWESKKPDRMFSEHLNDVKCVGWHPHRALIATGAKDNTVKLWDPRQATAVSTIFGHKNTVLCLDWSKNGNWLATGSRDHLVKVFDLRQLREISVYRGHHREVTSLQWHPVHESVLASGGFNGAMCYWIMGHQGPHTAIANAHNYSINTLLWHPIGHCVATGANDGIVKFWSREAPGSQLQQEVAEWSDPLVIHHGPMPAAIGEKILAPAETASASAPAATPNIPSSAPAARHQHHSTAPSPAAPHFQPPPPRPMFRPPPSIPAPQPPQRKHQHSNNIPAAKPSNPNHNSGDYYGPASTAGGGDKRQHYNTGNDNKDTGGIRKRSRFSS